MLRALRGATTVERDEEQAIVEDVAHLLRTMLEQNQLEPSQLVCAFFTATPDITSAFPARAARELGLTEVPLMGAQELEVKEAPLRCVRIMLLAQSSSGWSGEPRHVYLKEAARLRPDLTSGGRETSGGGSVPSGNMDHPCQAFSAYYYYPQH